MLMVAYVNKQKRIALDRNAKCLGLEMLNQIRSTIPAVTHVDYTARVQTVKKNLNPMYYAIINEFYQRTSCPIVINTSFNIRGEPIVCSPEDAYRCFMGTDLDILIMENSILYKEEQDSSLKNQYQSDYELD